MTRQHDKLYCTMWHSRFGEQNTYTTPKEKCKLSRASSSGAFFQQLYTYLKNSFGSYKCTTENSLQTPTKKKVKSMHFFCV